MTDPKYSAIVLLLFVLSFAAVQLGCRWFFVRMRLRGMRLSESLTVKILAVSDVMTDPGMMLCVGLATFVSIVSCLEIGYPRQIGLVDWLQGTFSAVVLCGVAFCFLRRKFRRSG